MFWETKLQPPPKIPPSGPLRKQTAKAAADPGMACPNCSAHLQDRGCKLKCPQCGFYLSCSDFY
jgi:hypothetical protein